MWPSPLSVWGLPTNEPAESGVCCAQRGLVEEEGMSSTICEPYEGGGLWVKVEGISSSESLSSLWSLSTKEEEGGVCWLTVCLLVRFIIPDSSSHPRWENKRMSPTNGSAYMYNHCPLN